MGTVDVCKKVRLAFPTGCGVRTMHGLGLDGASMNDVLHLD